MKARFTDATVWRYVITGISKVIKEGVFRAEEDALKLRAIDPSHVIMVDLNFPSSAFSEYEASGERIPVNLEELAKVLRRARSNDVLELRLEGSLLNVWLLRGMKRRFGIPLIELEEEELGEPRLELKASAKMAADHFREALRDVEMMGDNLILYTDGMRLVIANESEMGRAEVELTREAGLLMSLESEGEQTSTYSLEYMESILPAAQKADFVTIQFANDMPCKITFELPQGGWLSAYVAPRSI